MGAFPVSPLNLAAGFATRVGRFRGMSNAVQGHQGSTPARIGVRNSHIGRRARIRPKPRGACRYAAARDALACRAACGNRPSGLLPDDPCRSCRRADPGPPRGSQITQSRLRWGHDGHT